MSKVNKYVVVLFLAWFSLARSAVAFPLPTESISETFQAISQAQSEIQAVKSEISSTVNLAKQISNMGVIGFLKAFMPTDLRTLSNMAASKGYELYKNKQDKRQKSKENAQQKAEKQAKEKLQNQKEGKNAAIKAVDENRNITKKKKENVVQKAFNWTRTGVGNARSWTNTQTTKAGDWTQKQKNNLVNSITGKGKDSKTK